MQKVKYLDKDQQVSIIDKQLKKILTQSNLDRNTVIDFLIQDYCFQSDEAKDIQVFPTPMKFDYNDEDADLQRQLSIGSDLDFLASTGQKQTPQISSQSEMDFDDKPQENPLLSLAPDAGNDKKTEDNPYLSMMQFDLKSKVEQAVTKVQEVKEVVASQEIDILEFHDQTEEEKEEEDLLYGSNPFEDIFGSMSQKQ